MPGGVWRLGTIARGAAPVTVIEAGAAIYELDALLAATGATAPEGGRGVRAILTSWDAWRPVLAAAAAGHEQGTELPRAELSWLPPIPDLRQLVCGGANYRDHLAEMGYADLRLERPFAFVKPVSTLLGHRQTLVLPAAARQVDWEAELAIVIGRRAKGVRGQAALDAVGAYCPFNDVSARDWIDQPVPGVGMDWILHKSFDGFSPLGPLITPAEFVADPHDLAIRLTVNGEVKQASTTAQMIFGVQQIVEHLASVMTLEPGDVIATGSPAGVGHARGEYLQAGDRVIVTIEGLGELETNVAA